MSGSGPKKTLPSEGQILRFPGTQLARQTSFSEESSVTQANHSLIAHTELRPPRPHPIEVVLCGTFHKDMECLTRAFNRLRDLGCRILSPGNAQTISETDGRVFIRGEEIETSEYLQLKHLETIQRARFLWLHAPKGYVGSTAALEIGFARAIGVPTFSSQAPKDTVLQNFVRVVRSPQEVIVNILHNQLEPPIPALQTFQHYYRRVALERGCESQSPQNCLLLLMEEVRELARALWKREKLEHGTPIDKQEAIELADVFIYVVHMANILRLDLGKAVQNKEILNVRKTLKPS